MKVNVPSQIYLQVCGDCSDNDCKNCKFEDVEDNVTWCKDKVFEKDIEYIRKDAFIENACEYWYKYNRDVVNKRCCGFTVNVEDFRKCMKGE